MKIGKFGDRCFNPRLSSNREIWGQVFQSPSFLQQGFSHARSSGWQFRRRLEGTFHLSPNSDALDKFSTAASGVGLVTGGAALVTSETVFGGIGFGTVSGVSFAVSSFASGGAAVLNFAAHRYGNAAIDVFGVRASGAVGLAAKEMKPAVQLMRNAYGVGAGAAASSMCP